MDRRPESHLVTYLAVALDDGLHDSQARVRLVEENPLRQVADQLAEIDGSRAPLGVLPVDDEEAVGVGRRR